MSSGTAARKPGPGGTKPTGRIAAFRGTLNTWLGRPLTSFHLVLAVFGLLIMLGLTMVLTASPVASNEKFGSPYTAFRLQLIYVAIGLVAFWIALRIPLRVLRRLSPLMMLGSVIMLIALFIPHVGTSWHGARKWFSFGPVTVQPVELAKVALALWGAHVLVVKRALLKQWRHLLVPLVPVSLAMFTLIMLQPDLGSTVTLGVIMMALLWFVGAPMLLFGTITLGGLSAVAVLAVTASYRHDRVTSFFNPDAKEAYQANQALFALADGGWFGRGLGQSSAKWDYLPNVYNDFIFAVVGEELGFLGCLVVIGLFATLAYVGLRIAARNTDPWLRLVAAAMTVWIVAQAAINIGYVVGLLPVTGIPLPLISAGGTSVVVTMLVFGILANCARHEPEAIAALRRDGQGRIGKLLGLPLPDPHRQAGKRKPSRPSSPPRRMAGATAGGGGATVHQLEERRRARKLARGEVRRHPSRRGGPNDRFIGGQR